MLGDKQFELDMNDFVWCDMNDYRWNKVQRYIWLYELIFKKIPNTGHYLYRGW